LAGVGHAVNHVIENAAHRQRMLVEPKHKFVNVPLQVLSAHVVINAMIPALKQGPKTLNAVCVETALAIANRMVNRLVCEVRM
jgi:hypothetical protein